VLFFLSLSVLQCFDIVVYFGFMILGFGLNWVCLKLR
jgi:hypothetical protein